MTALVSSPVTIQTSERSVPSIPSWFGEVAAFAQVLSHTGRLKAIAEQMHFARARFGHYDLIDFVVVLIGYILSGEPTLLADLTSGWLRSPDHIWRFLAATACLIARPCLVFAARLDQTCVEALRTLFQKDLLARKPFPSPGGLFDRTDGQWSVIDVDGTRQTARQRALPYTDA